MIGENIWIFYFGIIASAVGCVLALVLEVVFLANVLRSDIRPGNSRLFKIQLRCLVWLLMVLWNGFILFLFASPEKLPPVAALILATIPTSMVWSLLRPYEKQVP